MAIGHISARPIFAAMTLAIMQPGSSGFAPVPLTLAERRMIDSWLTCIECVGGELDSVLAIGMRKPTAAVDTLSRDLLVGPVGQRLSNAKQQYGAYYQLLADQAAASGGSLPVTLSAYVAHYAASLSSGYRSRAAIALGRIGGEPARNALEAALDSIAATSPNFPAIVVAAVTFARDSLWTP